MSGVTVENNFPEVRAMFSGAVPNSLNEAAEVLRGWSVQLAPLDEGDLRGSAQVTPATSDNPTAHVSYDTVYAARQHEELGWRHTDGQAKYLEEPITTREDELLRIIATKLRFWS